MAKDEALKLAAPMQEPVATLFGSLPVYDTPPTAQRQCNWPTCQSEEYQQSLAEQIKQELVGDECAEAIRAGHAMTPSLADVVQALGHRTEDILYDRMKAALDRFNEAHSKKETKETNMTKEEALTTPPAHPAVPDAIIEAGESPEFRDGWNECRETMLQMLKARTA